MGQALIRGLLARGVRPAALSASDLRPAVRRRLQGWRVRAVSDNVEASRRADVVVLAVKPQDIAAVMSQLAPVVRSRQLVVSIAAGVTLRALESGLPGVPVVRVMPNLPATVGEGFSAFALGCRATAPHRAVARAICEAVGEAVELPERLLDAVTAVSGSGPAYLFFLAQAWEEAGARLGLPRAVAKRAVRQTLEGSLRLLRGGRLSPGEWIAKVASKRGTTEAALRVLARRRVKAHVLEALRAAAARSRELSCTSRAS